ncbi:MAG: HEAT repeat domain-containing protein, partial [Candidatus Binatia bacterium]
LHVRHQAIEALGKLDKAGIGPLLSALRFEKSVEIRQGIIRGLGEIGADEEVIQVFLSLLSDPSREVRYAIAEQLEKAGLFAFPLLVEALQNDNAEVRSTVRGIIVGIWSASEDQELVLEKLLYLLLKGSDRARTEMSSFVSRAGRNALEPLIQALHNPRVELRQWAQRMLEGLHWSPSTDEEQIAWCWAKEDWQQLLAQSPRTREPLLDALVRGNPLARQKAAYALEQLGERQAVEGLIVAAQQDQDLYVRQAAIQALGTLKDERAIPPLLAVWTEHEKTWLQRHKRLQDGYYRVHEHIAKALIQIGPAVLEYLESPDPQDSEYLQKWKKLVRKRCQRHGALDMPSPSLACQETESEGAPPRLPLDFFVQSSPLLMVVEDDANTQLLLRHTLERRGYQVLVVADGTEALWQLGQHQFALILSDITMPNFDGFQLLRFLKQKGIETPVILLTAHLEEQDEVRGFELGAFDYIKKPIQPAVLLQRVHRALAAFEDRREPMSVAVQV